MNLPYQIIMRNDFLQVDDDDDNDDDDNDDLVKAERLMQKYRKSFLII